MDKIAQELLIKLQYPAETEQFQNYYKSHPNYPSLYAITDSFSHLGIENLAVKAQKDQLEEFPEYFLAGISIRNENDVVQDEIVLVKKEDAKIIYNTVTGSEHELAIDEFRDLWNGLGVVIEKNSEPLNPFRFHRSKNLLIFSTYLFLIFMLSLFISGSGNGLLFYKLSTVVGMFLSYFIIMEKYEGGEAALSKICNFNTHTSCESIIKADFYIFKKIEFSDLPLMFFGVNFISLSFFAEIMPFIGLLSLLVIPVIGYSLYLQKVEYQKWCVLCLAVSLIVFAQAIYFLFNFQSFWFSPYNFLIYILVGMIFVPLWYFSKLGLKDKRTLLDKTNSLSRFKRNFNLFRYHYRNVKEANILNDLQSIEIGSKDAPISFLLFISPSCGHCHIAYTDAIDLVEKFPSKLKFKICYNLNPENSDNPFLIVARTILQINKNSGEVKKALNDWHLNRFEINTWMAKWKQPSIDPEIDKTLQKSYSWSQYNDLTYTPFVIIDDHLYPSEYELKELKFFLNEMVEEKQSLLV